jgi:16S rRNA (guanine527-N7)-methyltransferase
MITLVQLQAALASMSVALSAQQQQQLLQYCTTLTQWNAAYNLTALKTDTDILTQIVLDSLSALPYLHKNRIIDVGTGAGTPGLILAIAQPDKQFVLLDSNGKKTRFLTQISYELKLENVEIISQRVEQYLPVEKFETVISRAFSSCLNMIELTQHLISDKGLWLTMKGVNAESDISQLPTGFVLDFQQTVQIPGLKRTRYLIGIRRQ